MPWKQLKRVDPEKAASLSLNDHRRIIRALAFYDANGVPLSSVQNEWKSPPPQDYLLIGLNCSRDLLYQRIEQRVDQMMDQGLLDEVRSLLSRPIEAAASCWQAIGYRQLRAYLEGHHSLAETIRLIKRDSRRYAKRQLTWFRKVDNIQWFDALPASRPVEKIKAYFMTQGFIT